MKFLTLILVSLLGFSCAAANPQLNAKGSDRNTMSTGKYVTPKPAAELILSEPDQYQDRDIHASLCALTGAKAIANFNAWRTAYGEALEFDALIVGQGLGVMSTSCFVAPHDSSLLIVRTSVGTYEQIDQPDKPGNNIPDATFVSIFNLQGELVDWTLF